MTKDSELVREGDEITRDHEAMIQEHDRLQREFNQRHPNLTRNGNPYFPEMLRLGNEQINFDHEMRKREKNLRNEALDEIRPRRKRNDEIIIIMKNI